MDRNKVLSKIEKCMNLSKSSEPHEAAAALRQAQKLMETYNISKDDLDRVGYSAEKVFVPIQANKKLPAALARLVILVRKAFGVEAVMGSEVRVSDRSYTVTYIGPDHRVAMATYTHTVIFRAMNKGWTAHLAAHPYLKGDRGARAGYQLGWLDAIETQIMELRTTEEEAVGTELVKTQLFPTLVNSKTSNIRISGSALAAGRSDGAGFALHRPMNGTQNLRIGG